MSIQNLKIAFLTLIAIALLVLAYFQSVLTHRQTHQKHNSTLELGEIDRLEINVRNHTVEFKNAGSDEGKIKWHALAFDGDKLSDQRANSDLVNHIISAIKSSTLNAKEAAVHGIEKPVLAISMEWSKPVPGTEVVLFGNRDPKRAHSVVAFFPKKMLLAQTSSNVLEVIGGKTAYELLARNISTFKGDDDVNELVITGSGCIERHFLRDGATIKWLKGTPFPGVTDDDKLYDDTKQWLAQFLANQYVQKINISDETKLRPVCRILLKGLAERTENIDFFNSRNHGCLFRNTMIGTYYTIKNIDFLKKP